MKNDVEEFDLINNEVINESDTDTDEPVLVSHIPTEELHWYDNPDYNDGVHYNTKTSLNYDAEYRLINGGRSNGKTTGWQMQMIDDYFNYGHIYGKIVRKYEFDLSKAIKWFDELAVKYLKEVWHHDLVMDRFNYCIVPEEGEPDRYLKTKTGRESKRLNTKLICETFNLAYEVDNKSHDFKYIKKLIFEEYTLINQNDYLPNEVEHFQSLISTINRDRDDLSVVFIGNTISKHNPYFDWLGINVNDLKLRSGEHRLLKCNLYEDGARIYVEFVPTVYGKKIKCPRILLVGKNEIAITGDWVISEYVYDTKFDSFINGLEKKLNFAIYTNNKMYYHYTCYYKNTTFNIISSRVKSVKASGLIYEYDLSAIERIQNGTMPKTRLNELLLDVIKYETLFSDDEIEYKYNNLVKLRR